MPVTPEQVQSTLSQVIDPEIGLPITDLGMVGEIDVSDSTVQVQIKLTVSHCPMREEISRSVEKALSSSFSNLTATAVMTVMTKEELEALKLRLRGKDKVNPFGSGSATRVILVGSGKGGVGKSTITANLAVGLTTLGYQVGLVDADIFGFSIPRLMGFSGKPTRVDDMMMPPKAFGVKVISIGMFLNANEPVSWRGPMLHKAIEQFLTDVYWGSLDFLIIDMPPGTGDVAISVGQLLPDAKAIVVTTPSSSAAEVAIRSALAANKAGQEILGVVENMSWLIGPDGQKQLLFGSGGTNSLIQALSDSIGHSPELLAQIPISQELAESAESGVPFMAGQHQSDSFTALEKLISKVAATKVGPKVRELQVKLKT